MGQKSQKDAPFFAIFYWKISAPPIFCQITSILSKIRCSHVIFFQFFHEKPCILMPIFGQKNVNPVKTTLYYGLEKSLSRKKSMLPCHADILSKNLHSLKITMLPFPYFVKKHPFSQKRSLLMWFFSKYNMENPLL